MSELTFVPINDWIVVKEDVPKETVTKGGVIVPKVTSIKQKIKRCSVLAISQDVPGIAAADGREISYNVGDQIFHYSDTGIPLDVGNKTDKILFLKWDAVLAVCNPEEKKDE